MAYVQVFFEGSLQGEIELARDVTTVGRSSDCDIVIENAGVSALHARIVRDGDAFYIEDAGSKNGVFLKGALIKREPLNYGDELTIVKHTLKLIAVSVHGERSGSGAAQAKATAHNATVEVDVANLGDMVRQRQVPKEAYVLVQNRTGNEERIPLKKVTFTVGRGSNCDVRTPGWFVPKVAARIRRTGEGFVLSPEQRGGIRLNDAPLSGDARLKDGDNLVIRGVAMSFHHRPEP